MNGPFPSKVITGEHLPKIKKALADVNEALREHELASRAGIADADQGEKLRHMQERLMKFKQVYFPNH